MFLIGGDDCDGNANATHVGLCSVTDAEALQDDAYLWAQNYASQEGNVGQEVYFLTFLNKKSDKYLFATGKKKRPVSNCGVEGRRLGKIYGSSRRFPVEFGR